MSRDDEIAALLEAGATEAAVMWQLDVSNSVIRRVRTQRGIPVPSSRAKRPRADLAVLEQRAADMIREGARSRQVYDELHISFNVIARLRRELGIPAPRSDVNAERRLTIDQALARHSRPLDEGHLAWAGSWAGRMPELLASGQRLNARRITFEKHHGRPPVGYTVTSCRRSGCIAGAHLTDAVIRGTAGGTP